MNGAAAEPEWDNPFLAGFADCRAVPTGSAFHASPLGTNGAAHERLQGPLTVACGPPTVAFGSRRAVELPAGMEKNVDELCDRFAQALSGGVTADFRALAGYPPPVAAVGELIGVPRADREQFHPLVRRTRPSRRTCP
ncbi:hypothetical protein ACFY00_24630 [Kitasatospora sp. NPDC001540]|uniref:hypothetical protein n=1 Tax=Kitasatospora sp. NPDC001540 TaxID=3364014 RepID=UPI0036A484DA